MVFFVYYFIIKRHIIKSCKRRFNKSMKLNLYFCFSIGKIRIPINIFRYSLYEITNSKGSFSFNLFFDVENNKIINLNTKIILDIGCKRIIDTLLHEFGHIYNYIHYYKKNERINIPKNDIPILKSEVVASSNARRLSKVLKHKLNYNHLNYAFRTYSKYIRKKYDLNSFEIFCINTYASNRIRGLNETEISGCKIKDINDNYFLKYYI